MTLARGYVRYRTSRNVKQTEKRSKDTTEVTVIRSNFHILRRIISIGLIGFLQVILLQNQSIALASVEPKGVETTGHSDSLTRCRQPSIVD